MSNSEWFFAKGKKKLGPFSFAQLQERAREGGLEPKDMVLPAGSKKWVAADSVKGLFAEARASAAAPEDSKRKTKGKAKKKSPVLLWAVGGAGAVLLAVSICGVSVWAITRAVQTPTQVAQDKKKESANDNAQAGKKNDTPSTPENKTPSTQKPAGPKKTGENPANVKGLASVMFDGKEYVRDGKPRVRSVTLEQTSLNDKGFKQYQFSKAADGPTSASFDASTGTFWQAYSWGSAAVQYRKQKDRLDIALTLENHSQQTIANFDVVPLELIFPSVPQGWQKNQSKLRNSLDNLAIVEANFGTQRLIACNMTIDPPMVVGFDKSSGEADRAYPVVMRGGVNVPEPGAYVMEPHGVPRIEPGKSVTVEMTLRLEPTSVATLTSLQDVAKKFGDHHSPRVNWPDRRPIGMLIRASGFKGHVSATNPRGWFSNPKLDAVSPTGKAAFREAALQDARTSVKAITATGGQGMIFWDVEGQQNPHPISFIGDPRLVKKFAPEMDEVADDYFKVFRDAGLRTGICIRPTQLYFNESTKKWDHGTGSDGAPERGDFYPHLKPKDQPWWKYYPVAERLIDRIDYAKKRWGCTLFYVDTNGTTRQTGEDQKFRWHLLHADVWKRVQAKHPDVLLVLELAKDDQTTHVANWAHTAGYMEVDLRGYRTSDHVRGLIPGAFSVVVINDGDIVKNRDAIKKGVAQGDILMFRGWFGDTRNAWVKGVYDEVKSGK